MNNNLRLGPVRRNRRDYSLHQRSAGMNCADRLKEARLKLVHISLYHYYFISHSIPLILLLEQCCCIIYSYKIITRNYIQHQLNDWLGRNTLKNFFNISRLVSHESITTLYSPSPIFRTHCLAQFITAMNASRCLMYTSASWCW